MTGIDCEKLQTDDRSADLSTRVQDSGNESMADHNTDQDNEHIVCRVCQCAESDRRGDVALSFLGILPPLHVVSIPSMKGCINDSAMEYSNCFKDIDITVSEKEYAEQPEFVEFISPDGEVFICKTDIEACSQQDMLINLGCSCKSDIALAHYACALKWFVNHGSSICEICGSEARNIKSEDIKKIISSLKEYESLRERTATGEHIHMEMETSSGGDPDALAAIQRQRLCEISMWFNPPDNLTVSQVIINSENIIQLENSTTKRAIEVTGILLATCLLTFIFAWATVPQVGKKTGKKCLHVLLVGIWALSIVLLLRIYVLSRIKYGPARYCVIFVLCLLVVVWALRTHGAHAA